LREVDGAVARMPWDRKGGAIVEERGAAMTIERHCGGEKAP
jgi:hypothetical protein